MSNTPIEIRAKQDYNTYKKGEVYRVYVQQWDGDRVGFFKENAFKDSAGYCLQDLDEFLKTFALRTGHKKAILKKFGRE